MSDDSGTGSVHGSDATPASRVEHEDIQGLVRFGYGALKQACFVLLRVRDAAAARAWLAEVPVSTAVMRDGAPDTALQVALTCDGLRALGVPDDILDGFSPEFVDGMASNANRSRRLGDVGANEPGGWRWGGIAARMPHVMAMVYAKPAAMAAWRRQVADACAAGFDEIDCLTTADMDGIEPFGFPDGISQPQVDWARTRAAKDEEQFGYTNVSCLGEYLLGYPNEYGGYTDRPLLDARRDPHADLPRAEDAPDKADLGRNGSYLVMRQLAQDVDGFWRFVDARAGGNAVLREELAAAMVGRRKDGTPLIDVSTAIPGENGPLNRFTYDADRQGLQCPLGAHIRRSNPRNADLPPGGDGIVSRLVRRLGFDADALRGDLVASTRFHRLLRRGREYANDGVGLHFISLGANIGRQFEFVQGAWLAGTRFDGLHDESDPLLGNRKPRPDGTPTDAFSIPTGTGPDTRLTGLPQFVTVRGGAYFFLPGIRALRFLSKVQPP